MRSHWMRWNVWPRWWMRENDIVNICHGFRHVSRISKGPQLLFTARDFFCKRMQFECHPICGIIHTHCSCSTGSSFIVKRTCWKERVTFTRVEFSSTIAEYWTFPMVECLVWIWRMHCEYFARLAGNGSIFASVQAQVRLASSIPSLPSDNSAERAYSYRK